MAERRPALLVAVFVALALWLFRPIWNIDIFWHVVVGRLILEGGVPTQDVLSAAHPEAPWRTFQWGYEVLVAALDGLGGLRLVQGLHVLVMAGAALGYFEILRRRGPRWAAFTGLAVLLLLFEDRVRVRPHVFELAYVIALLPLLLEWVRGRGAWLGAVLLALVWANTHAVSAAWWVALVGAWALSAPRERARWGVLLAGFLGMVAVPQARLGALHALASHGTWPSELVPELANTWTYLGEGWWGVVVIFGVGAGLLCGLGLARDSELPLGLRIAALGCAVASLLMVRWVWFAALPVGLWLSQAQQAPRFFRGLTALAVVALVGRGGLRWSPSERLQLLDPGAFPVAACDWLLERDLRLPADLSPRWSGYYLYRLSPGATVLGDGRLVMQPDVVELLLARGQGDVSTFDAAVARYHTLVLLWPSAQEPPLDPSRWRSVYRDPVAEIWLPSPAWPLLEGVSAP